MGGLSGVQQAWADIYANYRLQAQNATDEATRKFWEANLKQIQPTLDALDITDGDVTPPAQNPGATELHGTDNHIRPDPIGPVPPSIELVNDPRLKGNSPSGFSTDPQVGPLSPEETKEMGMQLVDQLMKDFGLTKEQAAGIVGNFMHESGGLNPNMNQTFLFEGRGGPGAPTDDMNQGYGWGQWSYDRKEKFLAFSRENGLDPASPAANYEFLKHELETTERGALDALRGARTPEEAAIIFRQTFERAEIPYDQGRIDAANEVYSWL